VYALDRREDCTGGLAVTQRTGKGKRGRWVKANEDEVHFQREKYREVREWFGPDHRSGTIAYYIWRPARRGGRRKGR
jgi:hypothetical protein